MSERAVGSINNEHFPGIISKIIQLLNNLKKGRIQFSQTVEESETIPQLLIHLVYFQEIIAYFQQEQQTLSNKQQEAQKQTEEAAAIKAINCNLKLKYQQLQKENSALREFIDEFQMQNYYETPIELKKLYEDLAFHQVRESQFKLDSESSSFIRQMASSISCSIVRNEQLLEIMEVLIVVEDFPTSLQLLGEIGGMHFMNDKFCDLSSKLVCIESTCHLIKENLDYLRHQLKVTQNHYENNSNFYDSYCEVRIKQLISQFNHDLDHFLFTMQFKNASSILENIQNR